MDGNDIELVTLSAFAGEIGMDRSALRKALLAQGVELVDVRGPDTGFQAAKALTRTNADAFAARRNTTGASLVGAANADVTGAAGVVYLIQTDPEARPDYLKVGWTTAPGERFGQFRAVCPHMKIVAMWRARQQAFETVAWP